MLLVSTVAIKWSSEHWDVVTVFSAQRISANLIFPYLELRLDTIRELVESVEGDVIKLRNNRNARQVIAELVIKTAISKKANL